MIMCVLEIWKYFFLTYENYEYFFWTKTECIFSRQVDKGILKKEAQLRAHEPPVHRATIQDLWRKSHVVLLVTASKGVIVRGTAA